MTGITSYGFYIPKYRIRVGDIAQIWGKKSEDITSSLGIVEKAVAGVDEDSLTMAYESASMALSHGHISPSNIGVVFVGSESHPYAVNPTSTILAEFLGIEGKYLATDTQFACKAATGAIIAARALINSGFTKNALVSASDKAAGKPHDALEYSAGSGSVSLVIGTQKVAVEIEDAESFSSDTPDFWRREGIRYPSHGGRFTGKPSYFYHIRESTNVLFEKTGLKPRDFKYAVFHMPNGKFPIEVARQLGFERSQIEQSLVVTNFGNSYTASGLMGLIATLEHARAGDRIFFASYGSGAGSDAFAMKATQYLERVKTDLKKKTESKEYIDYTTYLKFMSVL